MFIEVESLGFAVLSMLGWGYGDFYVKKAMKFVHYYRFLRYVQLVGLVPIILLCVWFTPPMPSSLWTVVLIVAGGAMQFLNVASSYKAMSVGKVSIVAPVSSSSAIVSVILAITILGERLSALQILCIAIVIAGIIAASTRSGGDGNSKLGLFFALISAFAGGVYSILIKLISLDIGGIGTLASTRILVVIIVFSLSPLLSKQAKPADIKTPFGTVVVAAMSGFLGYFGRIMSIAVGLVSIAAPIANASPAVTVVLAQLFLKESLGRLQKLGIALVTLGVVLLATVSF